MKHPTRLWHAVLFAAFLPVAVWAEDTKATPVFEPVVAADTALDAQLFVKRPVVVFADSPNDPNFIRQMELLALAYPDLEERDVILVIDTDPAANTEWRHKLRPRGFSLVIMDKDLRPVIRKPNPWTVREITAAIDKLPMRRQEVLERNPAGR
jgi:hypothetical protein